MYFSDLTPYRYSSNEYSVLGTLNVGWLDRKYEYPTGETSSQFQERLLKFCASPVLRTRGYHYCVFCEHPNDIMLLEPAKVQWEGQIMRLGSAEIRVIYGENVYAAPNLIYHYVVEHNYKPPQEFIEAVLNGPLPGSPRYEEMREQYWE